MGGKGSGNWYRWSKKPTNDDYNRISINFITKHNNLNEATLHRKMLSWSKGEQECGSIAYIVDTLGVDNPHITLDYKSNSEPMKYKIQLLKTTPNYGGVRWWFKCPSIGCGRRVGALYGGKVFTCRKCNDLSYKSQSECYYSRAISKAQSIHKKLGGSGCTMDYTPKLKGMHWRTYNRLTQQMDNYERIAHKGMMAFFGEV